jgi:hypothetical protein
MGERPHSTHRRSQVRPGGRSVVVTWLQSPVGVCVVLATYLLLPGSDQSFFDGPPLAGVAELGAMAVLAFATAGMVLLGRRGPRLLGPRNVAWLAGALAVKLVLGLVHGPHGLLGTYHPTEGPQSDRRNIAMPQGGRASIVG